MKDGVAWVHEGEEPDKVLLGGWILFKVMGSSAEGSELLLHLLGIFRLEVSLDGIKEHLRQLRLSWWINASEATVDLSELGNPEMT